MSFGSIEKPESISDQAYELLYNAIISMRLKPGERLSENMVAEKLDVSKTPVREALKRLQENGLVVTRPQKGTFVAGIDPDQVRESCDIRVALECHAIARAIGKLSDADLEEMRERNRDVEEIESHEEEISPFAARRGFLSADLDFHDVIWQAAGNETLRKMVHDIYDRLTRVRLWALEQPQHIDRVLTQHRRIIEALEEEDREEAVSAMNDHLQSTIENLEQMMEALPGYFNEAESGLGSGLGSG